VLERRNEPYLRAFGQYLEDHWTALPAGFFDELAAFVLWTKTELRDPVAHGRVDGVGYEQLRRFRDQLLLSLGSSGRGVLRSLVEGLPDPGGR
jgi:hypothetical protein